MSFPFSFIVDIYYIMLSCSLLASNNLKGIILQELRNDTIRKIDLINILLQNEKASYYFIEEKKKAKVILRFHILYYYFFLYGVVEKLER